LAFFDGATIESSWNEFDTNKTNQTHVACEKVESISVAKMLNTKITMVGPVARPKNNAEKK
jgi:hypothetical protein